MAAGRPPAPLPAPGARRARRGMSLSELLVVLTLLGLVGGMSWPSLSAAWRRTQVSGAARELVSALALARSLSVGREGGMLHGILILDDRTWRPVAVRPGAAATAANCLEPAVGRANGAPVGLGPAVRIANFPAGGGGAPFLILFRADGIPTADGETFPAPASILRLRLESEASDAAATVVVNRAAGTARAD